MHVQVQGNVHLLADRLDEHGGRARLQQPGHVFDGQNVGSPVDDVLGQVHVVFQVVLRARRIADVTGVADGRFDDLAGLLRGVDGDLHVADVVQGIEDPEDVDPGGPGFLDESPHDVVGIVGVSDRVGPAHQHLEQQVGHLGPQFVQATPGIFVQEPVRDVERGAPPHLHREQIRSQMGRRVSDAAQIERPQPGCQQRLMGVAPGRVREPHPVLRPQPPHHAFGPLLVEQLFGSARRRPRRHRRDDRLFRQRARARFGLPAHGLVAVDHHAPDVAQDPGRAITARVIPHERGRLVDEGGVHLAGHERRMIEHVLQERDIGFDAANPEFAQRPHELASGVLPFQARGRHLGQERIVIGRHTRAHVPRTVVQPDAQAHGGPVHVDLPGVGQELVLGILRGDPRLNREPALFDRCLVGDADLGIRQTISLRDANLRLDQIASRDDLGDGMLDLDARVDLDEVVPAVVTDQEFDRASVGVVRLPRHLQGVHRQPLADLSRCVLCGLAVEVGAGRVFDHLLMPALDRTIPLEQVHQVAVFVAQNLNLDVFGANHQLFDEHRIVAEGLARLGLSPRQRFFEFPGRPDHAHAATAAATRGLHEDRVAHLVGKRTRVLDALDCLGGSRNHGHPRGFGDLACRDLVAERIDGFGRWAYELDPGIAALPSERRPLRQQAIAGMNCVDVVALGQRDDLVLGQIGRDRVQTLAYQVRLVRLVAVQVHPVLFGEYGHRPDAKLGASTKHANRDLSTIGAEHPTKAKLIHRRQIWSDEPSRVNGAKLDRGIVTQRETGNPVREPRAAPDRRPGRHAPPPPCRCTSAGTKRRCPSANGRSHRAATTRPLPGPRVREGGRWCAS